MEPLLRILNNSGVVDADLAAELSDKASRPVNPIGRMMLERQLLSVHQVGVILGRQADDPTALFGEIAVKEGFCTLAQVEKMIEVQTKQSPHVLDVALADDRIDKLALLRMAAVYIRHLESRICGLTRAAVLEGVSQALPSAKRTAESEHEVG
ncbi:hypothetical protein [Engelhardtia mirabilis]|uniref:Bacteriophage N4 adsorption protein B n=1 Tax=Engelhardtia mirabilis TaxID=2528011 RepID=A0A518BSC7_9BACT|nr:hypothetical protein Pla133_49880 [Planctomycetes bacterium Pla133]QDV04191.1 hypothetical protein Pla86_49860 [Planctomycetes bacterium Pla86]